MKMVRLNDILDPKENNFTLLRLLAALAVVVSHAMFLKSGNKADEFFHGVSVYNLGDHAVNVFFALSGLTIAASLERSNNVPQFLISRMLRIFPGLIVCTVLLVSFGAIIAECGVLEYVADARTLRYALKTISLSTGAAELPGVFVSNPYPSVVNASLWTLKFELLCYLVLAAIAALKLWERRRLTAILVGGWLSASIFLVYRFGPNPDQVEQLARFWFCFSFGVGLFLFRRHIRLSWALGLGLAALTWMLLGSAFERVLSPVATGYAALLAGSIPAGALRGITNKTDLSYGVYIFGWPISQTLIFVDSGIGTVTVVLISVIMAMALAFLSWNLVEKPSLRTRDRILRVLSDFVTRIATDHREVAKAASPHVHQPKTNPAIASQRPADSMGIDAGGQTNRLAG